jgi:four helix bundle protein
MENEIKNRTKKIAIEVIKIIQDLTSNNLSYIINNQIIRSSTSIGANYRAACRAKSGPDFINKLKMVEEEADETLYWLEILEETNMIHPDKIFPIKKELNEIISIIVASIKTLKQKIFSSRSY